jgi:hypothetical protein
MSEEDVDPANRELAEALGGLALAPVRTAPEQMWFAAGVEAGRRRARAWQAAAAGLAVVMSLMATLDRPAAPAERVVYVERPTATAAALATAGTIEPPSPISQLRLREAVLRGGVSALPASPSGPRQPLRAGPFSSEF